MQTGNFIIINASRERIYSVVSDLLSWPSHLPHYRYVRKVDEREGKMIVEMSAYRGRIPVTWKSAYEADREALELRFQHLNAWTKGMEVIWILTPTRSGTRVEIAHHLRFRVPLLAWLAEPIISNFIHHIASRTLATFKEIIERSEETPLSHE